MFPIVRKTAGPSELKFFEKTHGCLGGNKG